MIVQRTDDLRTCLDLRLIVFTHEQNVPEALEVDGFDDTATHFLAVHNEAPVGTARVLVKGQDAKIGRVCVLQSSRGTGAGRALIEACVAWAAEEGLARAILGAQVDALGFYEKLGFTAYGDVFDDAGIDHRMMERAL